MTLKKVNNPEHGECSNCRTTYRIGRQIMAPCKKFVMLKGELTEVDGWKEVDYNQFKRPYPIIPRHLIPALRKLFKNSQSTEIYMRRSEQLLDLDKNSGGNKSRKCIDMLVMQIS